MAKRIVLGLTGGMGCGKSTAAARLAQRGWVRVDSDELVRSELLPRPDVTAAIEERFGTTVLTQGAVDRRRLAERVFSDLEALRWLEALLHPRVRQGWRDRIEAAPDRSVVVEVPLLFEKNLEKEFDFTVCVATASALQLRRLEQRGLPASLARQRIDRQLPLAQKIERADFVLLNDGSLDFLHAQIDALVASFV